MKKDKDQFIAANNWLLSLNASFQRVNIYKKVEDKRLATDMQVKQFKKGLRLVVEDISANYAKHVNESNHLKNIFKIQSFTKDYEAILNNNKLLFGVCQKLLNLYLKQLWVLCKIPDPPHFPVDRIIQELLQKEAKKYGITAGSIQNWTQIDKESDYIQIIDLAKKVRDKKMPDNSIAELELQLYNQSQSIL